MWWSLLHALALVCIIEGVMPFLAPERWRDAIQRLSVVDPRHIRLFGIVLVGVGVAGLHLLH